MLPHSWHVRLSIVFTVATPRINPHHAFGKSWKALQLLAGEQQPSFCFLPQLSAVRHTFLRSTQRLLQLWLTRFFEMLAATFPHSLQAVSGRLLTPRHQPASSSCSLIMALARRPPVTVDWRTVARAGLLGPVPACGRPFTRPSSFCLGNPLTYLLIRLASNGLPLDQIQQHCNNRRVLVRASNCITRQIHRSVFVVTT